jgi:hypothetical protein
MSALGEMNRLRRYMEPKDFGKAAKPRTLKIQEGRLA